MTNDFTTHPIKINRGVLQGDCLSPLLFNLIINTLITTIKSKQISTLGYVADKILPPRHWFQFADDTAIVTSLQEDNKQLCNVFTMWTTWADLIIRVDKCHIFGLKKSTTCSIQYSPRVLIRREIIPPVETNKSFTYLGKQFNFGLNIENIKTELIDIVTKYITSIDKLPLKPLNKIAIIQRYVFSKLRWQFSIYSFTETWVNENIDNIINKFLRKWLQLPVSSNTTHLTLHKRKLGLNMNTAKTVYKKCQLSVRRILNRSKNPDVRKLFKLTSERNVPHDSIIASITNANSNVHLTNKQFNSKTDREFTSSLQNSVWKAFMNLNEQCILINHLIKVCSPKTINMWQTLTKNLPSNIFCFCRKSLIFRLPNKTNLLRWKLTTDDLCIMCSNKQTQLHVLSNCSKCLNRYTWRHDSILYCLLNYIEKFKTQNFKIYSDCPSLPYPNTSELFTNQRPDIVTLQGDSMTIIELTVCFETNTSKSRNYKATRYAHIQSQLTVQTSKLNLIIIILLFASRSFTVCKRESES